MVLVLDGPHTHRLRNEMHMWLKWLCRLIQYVRFFWEEIRKSSALWEDKRDEGYSRVILLMSENLLRNPWAFRSFGEK